MNHISQREVSYIEKRTRSSIGTVTLSPANRRAMVNSTSFDTFYDFIKYVDGNDLWMSLFKFDSKRSNAQFVRVCRWKDNAIKRIKDYCYESDIIIQEKFEFDFQQKLTRFSKSFKNLNFLLSDDCNHAKLKPIRQRILKCVRESSQLRTIFSIKPNSSKEFIDIIYDGIFTGKNVLSYIDLEYDLYNHVENAMPEQFDDIENESDYDDVPPLSSSSSSSYESVSDSEDDNAPSHKKTRSNENNQEDIEFDINQILPEIPQSPPKKDILDSIKETTEYDAALFMEMKLNDAIALCPKIVALLQDVLSKNPIPMVNFITRMHYTNYEFCLIQIEKALKSSKKSVISTLLPALIAIIKEDVNNLKIIPRPFFSHGQRQQYALYMQEMIDILDLISLFY